MFRLWWIWQKKSLFFRFLCFWGNNHQNIFTVQSSDSYSDLIKAVRTPASWAASDLLVLTEHINSCFKQGIVIFFFFRNLSFTKWTKLSRSQRKRSTMIPKSWPAQDSAWSHRNIFTLFVQKLMSVFMSSSVQNSYFYIKEKEILTMIWCQPK